MKKFWKRLPLLLVIFVLLFSLVSCGKSAADIGTAKAASDTLEFNFYEVTYTKKEDDLANVEFGELLKELVVGKKDGDTVTVDVEGKRRTRWYDVQVRVHPEFRLEMHIDTDDANAVGIGNGSKVKVVKE